MGKKSPDAMALSKSYPSPDSEEDAAVCAASIKAEPEASPPADRDSESCEPVIRTTRRRGNRRLESPSQEEWESVKSDIAQLYLDENRRLKDVMTILATQRGFYASVKMYKTKLAQWKFFKNNRQADVAKILHLKQQRLEQGKESSFRRNGRDVDVDTYMKRRRLQPTDLLEMARSGDLPPTLRCRTPPVPPMLKRMELPDDMYLQQAYLHWSHDHPLMPPKLEAGYLGRLDQYHESEAMRSVLLLSQGSWLMAIGRIREGGSLCQRAFSTIDLVLEEPAHFAVYELIATVCRYPDPGIYKALWGYLVNRSMQMHGVNGKLRQMLMAFARMAKDSSLEHNVAMLQWGRRLSSEQSDGTFDGKPFDYTLIQPWDVLPRDKSYHHRYYLNQGKWLANEIPTATIYSSGDSKDPSDLRADLLIIFGNQTNWLDERISGIALKLLAEMPPDQPSQYLRFACCYALALSSRARCRGTRAHGNTDHKLARTHLQQAIDVQSETWEADHNYYESLTLLESWHREAGDETEAEVTRIRRDTECQLAFRGLPP
ncbi:hypothetical protein F4777DRAFT_493988 [Nemania sp. FL0916]|nr:hypothetical protein F4777DRAFT_493988 [Nemania sp. FL0916]